MDSNPGGCEHAVSGTGQCTVRSHMCVVPRGFWSIAHAEEDFVVRLVLGSFVYCPSFRQGVGRHNEHHRGGLTGFLGWPHQMAKQSCFRTLRAILAPGSK